MFGCDFWYAALALVAVFGTGFALAWLTGWDRQWTVVGFSVTVCVLLYLPEWLASRRRRKDARQHGQRSSDDSSGRRD